MRRTLPSSGDASTFSGADGTTGSTLGVIVFEITAGLVPTLLVAVIEKL